MASSARAQDNAEVRENAPKTSSLGIEYTYQSFRSSIEPWHLAALSIGQRSTRGTVIGRVNYARRFGETGYQVEADAYPRLSDRMYAYLNLGYSGAAIFPGWRSGAELFTTLPAAYEASLGYRQLRFAGPPVTLFTGAVGKYVGNYWFSMRPYVRYRDSGTSTSASLTGRKYFADGDNWIGARAGFGSTPSDQLTADQSARTSSLSGALQGSGGVYGAALGIWTVGFDREELQPATYRNSVTLSGGVKVPF